ncbi:hypothetical protein E2542_SST14912 [Spatholobus suberectus]|nr:hypothetical protein E2542_SST14912 [Spatholobus suberectus]
MATTGSSSIVLSRASTALLSASACLSLASALLLATTSSCSPSSMSRKSSSKPSHAHTYAIVVPLVIFVPFALFIYVSLVFKTTSLFDYNISGVAKEGCSMKKPQPMMELASKTSMPTRRVLQLMCTTRLQKRHRQWPQGRDATVRAVVALAIKKTK